MAEVEVPNPEKLHEHSRDQFGRRVALVTALFAVLLAISALGDNHAIKEMFLAHQKSSDQWSFFGPRRSGSINAGIRSSDCRWTSSSGETP